MQSKLIGSIALIALIALTAAFATEAYAQKIYKTVDKDGNVVFTDVPPSDDTGAVELEQYNTFTPPPPPAAAPDSQQANAKDAAAEDSAEPQTRYGKISIIAPAYDESVRQNAGSVNVSVNISPQLNTSAGHRLQILLDGKIMAESGSSNAVLENVDHGTHEITAQVINAEGQVLAQSAPSMFHLHRYSILLAPQNKPSPSPSR